MAMAARKRRLLQPSLLCCMLPILLLTAPAAAAAAAAVAGATCDSSVNFLFPTGGLTFSPLDIINVTWWRATDCGLSTLSCWCHRQQPTQLFELVLSQTSFSHLVRLDIEPATPCWFQLESDTHQCQARSPQFSLRSRPRDLRRRADEVTGPTPAKTTAVAPTDGSGSAGVATISPGARAGLAVGIIGAGLFAGSMVAFFYLRRRRALQQDANLAGAIMNHESRSAPRGPEQGFARKNSLSASSGRTTRTEEPILETVFDGFPGSSGYDDVRSLYSGNWAAYSPASIHDGASHPWEDRDREEGTTRDELTAARLHSGPLTVSYGPNPVTPTLTRSLPKPPESTRSDAISIDSREEIPPMPSVTHMRSHASFRTYDYTPPLQQALPQPPRPAPPIVVSYGPNRVTPTPAVQTPTVPPDESVMLQKALEHPPPAAPRAVVTHTRKFSFDTDDDYDLRPGAGKRKTTAPLPPYASSAEYVAMEKGAIKKLPEPQAQAELPPTKDGYYHFAADVTEYELPGASQQLPHQPYRSGAGASRDIDEQKFLLSDVEMAQLKEHKANIRRRQEEERRRQEEEAEMYEMSEPSEAAEERHRR